MTDVLAIILGGGQGSRLFPLTHARSKPAVPIGGKYRLIDIPVSNCLHADLRSIYVLTQFNSASLNRHIAQTYRLDHFSRGFVEMVRSRYSGIISSVRYQFQLLRPENLRRIRGEIDGEDYDLQAVIDYALDRRATGMVDDRLYTRKLRRERDVAVRQLRSRAARRQRYRNNVATGFHVRLLLLIVLRKDRHRHGGDCRQLAKSETSHGKPPGVGRLDVCRRCRIISECAGRF